MQPTIAVIFGDIPVNLVGCNFLASMVIGVSPFYQAGKQAGQIPLAKSSRNFTSRSGKASCTFAPMWRAMTPANGTSTLISLPQLAQLNRQITFPSFSAGIIADGWFMGVSESQ